MNKRNRFRLPNRLHSRLALPSTRTMVSLAAVLALAVPMAAPVFAQSSANRLYQAVREAQKSLPMNPSGDATRDRFLIRQLETESAKGFHGDLAVFQTALQNLSNAGNSSREIVTLRTALQDHVDQLNQGLSIALGEQIKNLVAELQPVELETLSKTRDATLKALDDLADYHQRELSYYGRHYINKRLQTRQLRKAIKEFKFELPLVDPTETIQDIDESDEEYQQRVEKLESDNQNKFNRSINALRVQLVAASQRFSAASVAYPDRQTAATEKQIATFREMVVGYLSYQSRTRPARNRSLQMRKQVFEPFEINQVGNPDRLFLAELGRWLDLLESRGQADGLNAAARRAFSKPNFKVTIQESIANRLASRPVSQVDHVDQVIVGSRAQGWSYTNGLVNVDFLDSPYGATVRLNLSGSIQSQAYSKEGPVTAYTSSNGTFSAMRDIRAGIGNLSVSQPAGTASVYTQFLGTNCIPLVTKIARQRFSERQAKAQEVSSALARDQLLEQFTAETDQALQAGSQQLNELRQRENELLKTVATIRRDVSEILAEDEDGDLPKLFTFIEPLELPRIFVSSTDSAVELGGLLDGNNRLAAPSNPPPPTVPCDFRIQIHESMLSNLLAPFIQGRRIESWQFRNIIDSLASGAVDLGDENEDRPFSITFEDGRPVQFEFDNQEIGVTIFGTNFRQGRNSYRDPLNINVKARLVRYQDQLVFARASRAVAGFTYDPLEGQSFDVAFRSVLQDSLDERLGGPEPLDIALPLPNELLPLDFVQDEAIRKQLEKLRLVEFSADNGWLTIGWNYVGSDLNSFVTNTPGIWTDISIFEQKEEDKTEDNEEDEDLNLDLGPENSDEKNNAQIDTGNGQ